MFTAFISQLYYNLGHVESLCESLINCQNDIKSEVNPKLIQGDINMKGITLRKDGRYVIRKTLNGIRTIKYAKTLKEAQKIYTKIKKNILNTEKKKIYTLQAWDEEWLEIYKKPFISQKTYSECSRTIKNINNKLGKVLLTELKPENIQQFLNTYQKSRWKEKIQLYFNALLQKAFDLGLIERNPFKVIVKEPKLKCKNNCYNYEEQEKILNAIKGSNIEHEIYIYLLTGCRPNELPQNNNFDFKNNLVVINGTKTEKSKYRVVEISNKFAIYLKPYIINHKIKKVKDIKKEFTNICNEINVKPLLYKLRHTFATNHFTLGTNAKFVQDWMGHSSIKITLDTYTDIDKTSNKEKIKKLYNGFYFEKN